MMVVPSGGAANGGDRGVTSRSAPPNGDFSIAPGASGGKGLTGPGGLDGAGRAAERTRRSKSKPIAATQHGVAPDSLSARDPTALPAASLRAAAEMERGGVFPAPKHAAAGRPRNVYRWTTSTCGWNDILVREEARSSADFLDPNRAIDRR